MSAIEVFYEHQAKEDFTLDLVVIVQDLNFGAHIIPSRTKSFLVSSYFLLLPHTKSLRREGCYR